MSFSSGGTDRRLMPPPPVPSRATPKSTHPDDHQQLEPREIQRKSSCGLTVSPYFSREASQSMQSPSPSPTPSDQFSIISGRPRSWATPKTHGPVSSPISILGPSTAARFSLRPGTATTTTTRPPTGYLRSTSRAPSTFAGCEGRQIICAVSEGRGVPPSVGLAIIDIDIGRAVISQICDTQCYIHTIHKMRVHEPKEILIVSTAGPPNRKSILYSIIEEELADVPITMLDRKYWSERMGLEYMETLAFQEDIDALKVSVQGNFYAVCALSAALRHVELEASVRIAPHSLSINYEPPDDSMMIDVASIQALELLQNSRNVKSKNCLFGLLNNTLTPMGARFLRSCILQPSTKKEVILPRQEAVEELSSKEDMFFELRKAMKALPDIDKVVSKQLIVNNQDESTIHSEQSINRILQIKSFLMAISGVYQALTTARCGVLVKAQEQCRPVITNSILEIINDKIDKDAVYAKSPLELRNQRTFAVKSNIDPLLDLARQAYKEQTENLYEYVEKFNSEHNYTSEVKYDDNRKFWLRFNIKDFEDTGIPDHLVNTFSNRGYLECQTIQLNRYNSRISDAASEVMIQSAKVVENLVKELRIQIPHLSRLCQAIGYLDMLASLAHVVTVSDYCRPELTSTLALTSARHPVVEKCVESFVPNNYYISKQYSFQIVTGCNMSGKSTYIKTVALLQVMAQIGSFVPAHYASLPITHKIFTRMSKDDSIESNLSTFSTEMREMAFILRNIDSQSLVVVDELGRGTSTRDGLAIAIAVSEALIESGAQVLFATHFGELAKVLNNRPHVVNQHLHTETSMIGTGPDASQKVTMLHKIANGPLKEDNYGIILARAIGFPLSFLEEAQRHADKLRRDAAAKKRSSNQSKIMRRRALVMNLQELLLQAQESEMDDSALTSLLRRLQADFVSRMAAIDEDNHMAEESEDEASLSSGGSCPHIQEASILSDSTSTSTAVSETPSQRGLKRSAAGSPHDGRAPEAQVKREKKMTGRASQWMGVPEGQSLAEDQINETLAQSIEISDDSSD